MKLRSWLAFALITTISWGFWGAFIEIPEKAGFPATMGYIVWAITMIIPAVFALKRIHWKLDSNRVSIRYGLLIGLSGSAGQLILFQALRTGPAYLVFPIVSLSPIVTILLSIIVLKEKASLKAWTGIIIALIAIPLLSYQPAGNSQQFGIMWIFFCIGCLFNVGYPGIFYEGGQQSHEG